MKILTGTFGENNHTHDFGFTPPLALGDFVWNDANNDGLVSPGEVGIPGVTVNLYRADASGNPIDEDSGTPGLQPFASIVTNATGHYLFTGLTAGDYIVEVVGGPGTPLDGFVSSTGKIASASGPYEPAPSPNNDIDDDDNGTTVSPGLYRSSVITLAPGTEPVGEPHTPGFTNGLPDANSNVTVDFGFVQTAALGDFVWLDANGDGRQDPGEPGLAGLPVTLLDAAGNAVAGPVLTDAAGKYRFDHLLPGEYRVRFGTAAAGVTHAFTLADRGDDAADSDADPATGTTGVYLLGPGEANLTADAGLFRPVTIGNFVWNDTNGNGIQDAGEPGIANVVVTLSGSDGAGNLVFVTTNTDANGFYLFSDLAPGTYSVSIDVAQPALSGFNPTLANQSGDVSVDSNSNPSGTTPTQLFSGQFDLTIDFGFVSKRTPSSSISGLSYYDRNQNGVYEPGVDAPMASVIVVLSGTDVNGNPVTLTQVTGPDGKYQFSGLVEGNYTVTETQPSGYGNSEASGNTRTVVLPPNTAVTGQNFGNTLGSLSGVVYIDYDMNGVWNPAGMNPEVGIPGITITLSGTDANGNAVNRSTVTGADGSYRFDDLLTGNYTITQTQPPMPSMSGIGFYDGADNLGSLGGSAAVKNSLAVTLGTDPSTGVTQSGSGYNFGELPPADPFGFVYEDVNLNGVRDPGEPGISGVAVTISGIAFAGTPFARPLTAADAPNGLTQITDANGRYEFFPIPPGLYTLTQTQPVGYLDGLEENADPNPPFTVVVGNDVFSNIMLMPFPIRGPFNFGEYRPASVAGAVYFDENRNGVQDPGELGIAGVTITLTGTDVLGRPVTATRTTDAGGNFRFTDLFPGTYNLSEAQPAGFNQGVNSVGTAGGVLVATDIFGGILLGSGTDGTGYLFGEVVQPPIPPTRPDPVPPLPPLPPPTTIAPGVVDPTKRQFLASTNPANGNGNARADR